MKEKTFINQPAEKKNKKKEFSCAWPKKSGRRKDKPKKEHEEDERENATY